MEMIKRKHGWLLRIGGHSLSLTQYDVQELQGLIEEATDNAEDYGRNECIPKCLPASMNFFRGMTPHESVRFPITKIREASIRSRLTLLKRKEGITFTCHRDDLKSEMRVTRIS